MKDVKYAHHLRDTLLAYATLLEGGGGETGDNPLLERLCRELGGLIRELHSDGLPALRNVTHSLLTSALHCRDLPDDDPLVDSEDEEKETRVDCVNNLIRSLRSRAEQFYLILIAKAHEDWLAWARQQDRAEKPVTAGA